MEMKSPRRSQRSTRIDKRTKKKQTMEEEVTNDNLKTLQTTKLPNEILEQMKADQQIQID